MYTGTGLLPRGPLQSPSEGSSLQRQGAGHCKHLVLALGVSSPTETPILLKGCKSNFLEESSIDFEHFEVGAEFAFSYGCVAIYRMSIPVLGEGQNLL